MDDRACAVCRALLGKRRLKPRHHCRVCERLVCGACSPGRIPLEGKKGVHRICKACAANAGQAPALQCALRHLFGRLSFAGSYQLVAPSPRSLDLEATIQLCQNALSHAESFQKSQHAQRENQEAELRVLRQELSEERCQREVLEATAEYMIESYMQLANRLSLQCGVRVPVLPRADTLEEALSCCSRAIGTLETRISQIHCVGIASEEMAGRDTKESERVERATQEIGCVAKERFGHVWWVASPLRRR